MQADVRPNASFGGQLGRIALGPILAILLALVTVLGTASWYESQHTGRIFTGVSIGNVDVSGMLPEEAAVALATTNPAAGVSITLVDPSTDKRWSYSAADLGLVVETDDAVAEAMIVGRGGSWLENQQARFDSWYFGQHVTPMLMLDEGALFAQLEFLRSEIDSAPQNAGLIFEGDTVSISASQTGRRLDSNDAYERILMALSTLQSAEVELLIHENTASIANLDQAEAELAIMLGSPIEFYIQNPIDDLDLQRISIPTETLTEWLRISYAGETANEALYDLSIDQVALSAWLESISAEVARDPVNARFYFDDPTEELVLVEPHTDGRELDILATMDAFNAQIGSPNRSVPLIMRDIRPVVHSGVTAEELGITELIREQTTWFTNSTDNRKANIARTASRFYGIVVAPGEEFSFNHFLGDVSEEAGFETGLIIFGGQTIEGVGGGVCQVSTTLFQTAFFAGLDLGERWEHAYRVPYYETGEGVGMDATVYTPIVDFTFTNNTPHHILIENYYNEEFESLTFKIYSTDIGRRVEKIEPTFANVQGPPPDEWVFNPELEAGEIIQTEFAAEGGVVTIGRVVYNFAGEVRDEDTFVSNYIPWANRYEYGPDVDPDAISSFLIDELWEYHEINIFDY